VKGKNSYSLLVGMQISAATMEISMKVSQKKKIIELPCDPVIHLWVYTPKNQNQLTIKIAVYPCLSWRYLQ
jgi:hypothetical protein